jgi:hypothetical protein
VYTTEVSVKKTGDAPIDAVQVVETHKEQTIHTPATTARAEFFKILEDVVSDPTLLVYIEHRHLEHRGVLVSEQYVEYVRQLERAVADLLADQGNEHGFALCGTGKLHGDLDDALSELRAGERGAGLARLREL